MQGSSVLKYANGTYRTFDTPTQNDIALATTVYMGGHIYEVDEQEAQALVAAGYEVSEI